MRETEKKLFYSAIDWMNRIEVQKREQKIR